jgi:hypothetical protein
MTDTEKIRNFLQRVATEVAYRTQLENDPIGTLTAAGFDAKDAKGDLPSGAIKLPSNEDILKNLDGLTAGTESKHWHKFFS